MQFSELLQMEDRIEIEGKSTEGGIPFPTSGVCGCSNCVQQCIVLFGAGEHSVIDVSSSKLTFSACWAGRSVFRELDANFHIRRLRVLLH